MRNFYCKVRYKCIWTQIPKRAKCINANSEVHQVINVCFSKIPRFPTLIGIEKKKFFVEKLGN